MSSESAASNSFLVLNATRRKVLNLRKVQNYKLTKLTGSTGFRVLSVPVFFVSLTREDNFVYSPNISPFRARSVFSTDGHTVTKLRESVNSATAADLIFLHDSSPVVEVHEAEKDKKRKRSFSQDYT